MQDGSPTARAKTEARPLWPGLYSRERLTEAAQRFFEPPFLELPFFEEPFFELP